MSSFGVQTVRKVSTLNYSRLAQQRLKHIIVPVLASPPVYSISRTKVTLSAQGSQNVGTFAKILKKIGWFSHKQSTLKRCGYYLYETATDQVHCSAFFEEFKMEDTFFSWFLVTELHVWMLLVRLMAEGEEGRFVRNNLIEAMWADVTVRAKKLDILATSVLRAHLIELSEQFQAAIIGYDEGLLSEDRVLAGAIWRRFFQQKCCNPLQIECLVKYIRAQVKMLDELPQENLFVTPSVSWISLQPIEEAPLS